MKHNHARQISLLFLLTYKPFSCSEHPSLSPLIHIQSVLTLNSQGGQDKQSQEGPHGAGISGSVALLGEKKQLSCCIKVLLLIYFHGADETSVDNVLRRLYLMTRTRNSGMTLRMTAMFHKCF